MSLYVTNKNQDLLWNVINKNKQITSYFNQSPNENINEWYIKGQKVYLNHYHP